MNAFSFVLQDSFATASGSTSDLEAGIYSILKTLELWDDTSFSGDRLAAYRFVDDRLVAAGVNQWTLTRYRQMVAGKINQYSRGV